MHPEPGLPADHAHRVLPLTVIGMLLALAVLFASLAGLPFFSETYNHSAFARAADSWGAAFDPARVPLRPLQHIYFHVLTRWQDPDPGLARLPGLLLHFGSALLVICLARQWGARIGGACLAGWLFLVAPNVKNLVWVAAINAPGRVFCLLALLVLFRHHEVTRSRLAALGAILAFALALGFHQAAIVAPAVLMAGIYGRAEGSPGARVRACVRGLRGPLLASLTAVSAGYVFYISFLRDVRHHGPRPLDSLPANAVKGSLALVPEELRVLAVEALRGNAGSAGYLLGGSIVLGVVAFGIVCILRGRPASRFAALAIALDIGLHAATSGFDQRYAYFSSALLAVALGLAFCGGTRLARMLCFLVLPWWLVDQVHDVREYRAGGTTIEQVLETAGAERARLGPEAVITMVDLPEIWGRESDMPLLDWGFPQAMEARGGGRWVLLRTRTFYKNTSAKLVTLDEVRRRLSGPAAHGLIYDRAGRRFVHSVNDLPATEEAP